MAMRGGPRLQVGSAAWIAEERQSALNIAQSERDEFSFSARNEIDWLNEHMAEIFSGSQMNVAELFKTPGKLRGKTPRTARKGDHSVRVPLSNMFSATPKGAPNPFTLHSPLQPRSPRIQVAEDKSESPAAQPESAAKPAVVHPPHQVESRPPISLGDSGYHGSQSQDTMPFEHFDKDIDMLDSPHRTSDPAVPPSDEPAQRRASVASHDQTMQSTDGQPKQAAQPAADTAATPSSAMAPPSSPFASRTRLPVMSPRSPSPQKMSSPARHSPLRAASPPKPSPLTRTDGTASQKGFPKPSQDLRDAADAMEVDDPRSPSEASSPIRPLVRKSSLNFASLPAREPLASKKSIGGARMSRTSHLDLNRQSYYNRQTGGKSLGNAMRQESPDDHDDMDLDHELEDDDAASHSKTYTQRLQDQISMLGKGQSMGPRSSKSSASALPSQVAPAAQAPSQVEPAPEPKGPSPPKQSVAAPGAFPDEDGDEDDWIEAPTSHKAAPLQARHADLAGDVDSISAGIEPAAPESRPASPGKAATPVPERTPKHAKSASVPTFPTMEQMGADMGDSPLKKTISASSAALSTVAEDEFGSPLRSPTRAVKDGPLKQVKNKLTSLLKGSKGLIASSAALSAESKSSLLQSPPASRLGYHSNEPSVESFKTADTVAYPDLSQHAAATAAPLSPVRSNSSSRRTRASAERERMEAREREREEREREREREKEQREAKRLAEQMEKLEKAREKEREKARVFSEEQKVAAMEKQVAAQKEQEAAAQSRPPPAQAFRTPGPAPRNVLRSPVKTTTRPTPHAAKGPSEEARSAALPDEDDVDMADATTTVPLSIPRPTTASSVRAHGTKRPIKPTKEAAAKSKQAPTLIRVNTTSSQQTQMHPSNSVLSATLHDTLGQQPGSARQPAGKASQASLHGKASVHSLKSSVSSTGRPKALEQAAKRREQEERETQRKRNAKLELDRKRAAQEEERKQEQQRKLEAERQKEEERKAAQRRAAIERAKQTKAPPPAARPQPNGPPEYVAEKGALRPPSRLGSTMHQDRLVNTVLSTASKANPKRPLQQDAGEESSRAQQPRALPSAYPAKEGKRMRMSEEFDEDLDMMDSHTPRIRGPPVRPSGGFKKELAAKSAYGGGYGNGPPASATKDLFKATVTAQHNSQARAGHPLDMAHYAKGAIPFAANPGQAGPSHHHKTPGRAPVGGAVPKSSAAKPSTARSSPRFQNGDAIELPDIQTDDDSDDDDGHMPVAAWADSPALKAALLAQERVDPMQVFGPPAPLNMEEVFSKTKERWGKFRARTSSANWSGADRLTEEDIRKDMAARDKMRREGGWSYELSREMS